MKHVSHNCSLVSFAKDADIPVKYKTEFINEIIAENLKREKLFSLILIMIDLVLLSFDAAASDFWKKGNHIFGEFASFHIIMLLVPSVFLLLVFIGEKINLNDIWFCKISHLLLITAALVSCALVSTGNASYNVQPTDYIVAMICISSLILLENYEIWIVNISAYIIYIVEVSRAQADFRYQIKYAILLAILIILVSIVSNIRYTAFKKSFLDKKTILEKSAELNELSALLKATIDNIPDTITVKNTEREFILCNKAAMNLYKAYNAVQKNTKCYEYMGRNSVCPDCVTSDVMISNQPARKEVYMDCTNNWLDVRAYPILDSSNHVIKIVEHIRDITTQKETEMQLQRSYSILRAQLETSPDGILILDKNYHILAYNKKFVEVWNIPINILTTNAAECEFEFIYLGNRYSNESRSKIEELLHYFPHDVSNQKIQLKDGTILNVFSKPILSSQVEAFGRVWYFRDITERESMDEALRKSAEENEKLLLEAKKFDELKSEFFTNISHEFRTPINVLLGILQLLNMVNIDMHDIQLREKLKKYFSIMKQNCYRLLKLTNNLIDMSKLDTGFFEINLQNHNIVQIVEEITLSVAAYIENKGISLVFDTDVEEKFIAVDADKIERVILNLLSNAVKFTKENGIIQVNMKDNEDTIEISIRDTGIGIPAEKLDIIFQRFRQVNSSLSRENEGSGIGLSLTKNLVELHGGTIRVSSVQGEGSEFVVILPCRVVSEEMKKPVFYTTQNHVERINLEFSDIYSL